jgi:DNA-directed RNA polymerase beta' subunit
MFAAASLCKGARMSDPETTPDKIGDESGNKRLPLARRHEINRRILEEWRETFDILEKYDRGELTREEVLSIDSETKPSGADRIEEA